MQYALIFYDLQLILAQMGLKGAVQAVRQAAAPRALRWPPPHVRGTTPLSPVAVRVVHLLQWGVCGDPLLEEPAHGDAHA